MQSFRASPWVSYDPSLTTTQQIRDEPVSGDEMDEDVDMEAPQISTLREEVSPPPTTHKKATANPRKRPSTAATSSESRAVAGAQKAGGDDVEDEEDQLIDELIDDDDAARPSPSSRSTDTVQKPKAPAKRKPRKEKKAGEGVKKTKENGTIPMGAQSLAPTVSLFNVTPSEAHEDVEMHSSPALATLTLPADASAPKTKKKVSPRKPPTIPRAKIKLAKQKSAIPNLILEDAGILSESYAGTTASSPVTAQFEQNSPEPENLPPSSPPPSSAALLEETPNLENVPIPVYPLPTKPFPVQPPPKIPTGFAPLIPLEKSGRKVRHWREANREIRGIAGGHWLSKAWVGDKESELATHLAAVAAQGKLPDEKGVALPKLPALASISAPATTKSVGKLKASSKSGSAVTSANPSRAPSVVPDALATSVTSAVRAPTKMRILQQAPSEAGDSVMEAPAGV